ncbi:MAG: SMP-30/gluconolactonase/LRE family protein [Thaumarchaeota archaeon]|nr:SMP-30/gluconolactonase/LRE family protein [Nitrososphaerota archaeon]
MAKNLIIALAVLSLLVIGLGAIPASAQAISTVKKFDPAALELPESLAIDAQGNIYLSMVTGEIRKVSPTGQTSTFASLPPPVNGTMTGLAFDPAGNLYVGLPSFDPTTHGIWRVTPDGSASRFTALVTPDGQADGFPNGLIFDKNGNLYVSDLFGGRVWKIDQQGAASVWSGDPLLRGETPLEPPFPPVPFGANGLAFDADGTNLYAANFEFGRIVRIALNPDGSAGRATVFVENQALLGGADGITFDEFGNLYVAIFLQDRVAVVSRGGDITVVAEGPPLNNPSEVRFGVGAQAGSLFITNFAFLRAIGVQPGTPEPALLVMPAVALQVEVLTLRAEIQQQKAALQSASAEARTLRSDVATVQGTLQGLQSTIEALGDRIDTVSSAAAAAGTEASAVRSDVGSLRADVQRLQAAVQALQQPVTPLPAGPDSLTIGALIVAIVAVALAGVSMARPGRKPTA